MRSTLLLLALSSVALAQTASPASQTLERAIKLYDRKDFFATTTQLQLVLDGKSGDDATNTNRAQFFLGKTWYQLGFYLASNTVMDAIAANPAHNYRPASAKWATALARVIGAASVTALARFDASVVDDPSLATVKDDLHYEFGAIALRKGDFAAAAKQLAAVADDTTPTGQRAHVAAAIALAGTGDDRGALAQLAHVRADSDVAEHAALLAGWLHLRAKHWDDALAALKGNGARLACAASIAARAKAGVAFDKLAPPPPLSLDGPSLRCSPR